MAHCLDIRNDPGAQVETGFETEEVVSEKKLKTAMEYLKEKSAFCFLHREKEVSLFCRSCDRLVCTSCLIDGDHSNHKFCEMDDVVTTKRKELNERLEQTTEEMVSKVQQNIRTITMKKENVVEICKNVSAEVDNRKMELSTLLEVWSQNQQSLIKTHQENQLKRLDMSAVNSEISLAILESFKRNPKYDENINGTNLVHVLEMLQNTTGVPTGDTLEGSHEGKSLTFSTEMGNADKMEQWFGQVTGTASLDSPSKTSTKFRFCDSQIDQISPISAKKAFVVTTNKLYLVDTTLVKYMQTDIIPVMTNVKYITPVTERGIYVQQTCSTAIKRVTSDGQLHHFVDFKTDQNYKYSLQTIRISHSGMILLAMEVTGYEKEEQFHEYNNNGIKLSILNNSKRYREQRSESVHTASAFYMLDTSQELPLIQFQPGNVVNIETGGKYEGVIGPEPAKIFHPRGLCKDQDDRLIVSDYWNHTIHQLTCEGKFQKFLMTEYDGPVYPTAVGIDNINWLWVAQSDGHIHVVRYIP
ncbi:uncharacterized protein LOC110466621 [Mizuhopecten yessoensis]|uniref:uncharacterized protein LOC110466621 n=1 Tax=Mizuhopecten yessoensis TaxID=6573 RepID=UPI000B459E95|nr:uncharacterized protein LOC110466621 [Mizuhopecten yessoensis]XP_021378897.1 uncharacterized protein LOC110466621 [Mizuhopecten yessoensis]XP_021378898.1 uncharacterized protein LOC110466621 [Mizuhopecten yessoensis]XP_021378899.1 uncharacterized protein LOC110466621 [Mizuhopecten yessoensis]